jgi:lactate permease
MGFGFRGTLQVFWHTIVSTRFTMITIAALMGLAFVARFCGLDTTLGLAFARTGTFYPFFGTLIGWLGAALHGFGHFFQRSFRKPAEIHRPETRNLAVHDGVG